MKGRLPKKGTADDVGMVGGVVGVGTGASEDSVVVGGVNGSITGEAVNAGTSAAGDSVVMDVMGCGSSL